MHITQLSDNRYIGISVFEISKVPYYEVLADNTSAAQRRNKELFSHMITQTYRLCAPESVAVELLWLSEPVAERRFNARVRLFCLIRNIGVSHENVKNDVDMLCKMYTRELESFSYTISEIGESDFAKLHRQIDKSAVRALVKSEKIAGGMQSTIPYYYCDLLFPNDVNFSTVFNSLCNEPNSAVSLSLIPAAFSETENGMIAQIEDMLKQIKSGISMNMMGMYRDVSAEQPSDTYSHYMERSGQPLFVFNILVMGGSNSCAAITSNMSSELQTVSDKGKVCDLSSVSLTSDDIEALNDIQTYPWNINNRLIYSYRNMELWRELSLYEPVLRLPFIITSDEAASFFKLPIDDKNTFGLISNKRSFSGEQLPESVTNKDNIQFGTLADSENVLVGAAERFFTQHALIVGTPGTGKTTFMINLLLQFSKRSIPFLIVEPTKAEYRALLKAIPDLQVFTPGNNSVSPYIINPFIPPKGVRIEQYIPSLASAFKAAFSMFTPLDMLFLRAVRECYNEYGWKDSSMIGDADITVFGLYEFILVFKRIVSETRYNREYREHIESAGLLRLMNLIEQNSNIYDTVNTIPIEDLLSKPTVLELDAIDNTEYKALIMALLLIGTCVYTKQNHLGKEMLKNVFLIDEAHVILGETPQRNADNAAPEATTVKALQRMVAEIRSYGTSIIIADQSPTKVSREVVANTEIKIAFRLVQAAEKSLIADSTNMNEQIEGQLSRLKRGEALVYYSELEYPVQIFTEDVRERDGIKRGAPDDEIAARMTYWHSRRHLLIPYSECRFCSHCTQSCDFDVRAEAEFISSKLLRVCKSSIGDTDILKKYAVSIPKLVATNFSAFDANKQERLICCVKVKFIRKIQLETTLLLKPKEIAQIIRQRG